MEREGIGGERKEQGEEGTGRGRDREMGEVRGGGDWERLGYAMQYREKHALHDQWACHAIYHVIVTKRGYRGESFRAHYVMLAHYSDCFLYLSYILYIKKQFEVRTRG